MTLNTIYDNRRPEKYPLLIEELIRQHILDHFIWDACIEYDVVKSISESHKRIVQYAKDSGLPEVCIAEDDVSFPNQNGFEWFLKNKPVLYDLYSSCNYIGKKPVGQKGAFRSDTLVGFQLYMVHSRYYDTFLATTDKDHIDSAQRSKLMYFCYPYAAIQRAGWSANNKMKVDYNFNWVKDGDLFTGDI